MAWVFWFFEVPSFRRVFLRIWHPHPASPCFLSHDLWFKTCFQLQSGKTLKSFPRLLLKKANRIILMSWWQWAKEKSKCEPKNSQKPPSNLPTENEQRQKRVLKDLELVYQIGFDDWFCGHWKRYPHFGAQNYPLLKTSCFINEDQKTWDGIR